MSSLDKLARQSKVDEVFMTLLRRHTGQGRNVSHKAPANAYAPTEFAKADLAKQHNIKRAELAESMERLFTANKIIVETYGKTARPYQRIVVA
jgi:hypothetical protein